MQAEAVDMPKGVPSCKDFAVGVSILVRRESDGKYLVVQEFCNQGYYMPAGIASHGETTQEATVREAVEEAGVEVELTGIIRVRYEKRPARESGNRFIVQYLGRACNAESELKSVPDFESIGAVWASEEELSSIRLRNGAEVLQLISMSKDPKHVWPLSALSELQGGGTR